MPMTGAQFDWRGFWADLLSGAGRSLLELDGSREAAAALSGLDYFAAMQRRRLSEQSHAPADAAEVDPGELPEQSDRATGARPAQDFGAREDELPIGVGGLPPRTRPAPLSANPYDHPGLPFEPRLGQRGFIRRR